MRTFSKALGLAGLRIGYFVGDPALLNEFRKARLPFVVDAMAEEAALRILERRELVEARVQELKSSRREIEENLRQMPGIRVIPSQANFVIFGPPLEPSEVMARLAGAGVLVRDVSGYPELRGFLRVNAGTPAENRAFLAALKDALSA
jgi:histidinol-phosphate aminotransferase